jgi:NADH pyrophosphatase NudC (nudix superfamily)
MVSAMATEPPQYCSKCRNPLFCPKCGEPVSNVDTEDREYSCTKCTKVISRVPPPAAAAQRLQPAAAPLSLGG